MEMLTNHFGKQFKTTFRTTDALPSLSDNSGISVRIGMEHSVVPASDGSGLLTYR